jgi:uncharacterized protein (DUF2336 family)
MPNPRTTAAASRTSPPPVADIVRRFLVWAQRSSATERADAASALARAYLYADMPGSQRDKCAVALATLIDDPYVAVRRALAEAFAAARSAPRALVVALANDRPEVAAPVLARSPLLSDAELVDCIVAGDVVAQCAVARRPHLGPGPAAALAEVGGRDAALAPTANAGAALTPGSFGWLMQRFRGDVEILQALGARGDLPAYLEAEIALAAPGERADSGEGAQSSATKRDVARGAIAARRPEDERSQPDLSATAAASRTSPPPVADVVRRFLARAQRSGAPEWADASSALARAYLHADMTAAQRGECAVALAALIDVPHIAVRRALAEAFASSRKAPRALVVALANDRSEVAAPLLARSPLITDAELVDHVAAGDALAQCAIARRPDLGAGPAAALAEVGTRDAALALIGNASAALTPGSLGRLMARFGADVEIRQALGARTDLPANIRAEIAIGADVEPAKAGGRAARDAVLAAIAAGCPEGELPELVRTLRARRALTIALILRSLLSGERRLFSAALAELTGFPHARVAGFLRDPDGPGFATAAMKAGLPRHALPAFRAALAAIAVQGSGEGEGLKSGLVSAVIAACEAKSDPALAPFLAFLWRLAFEATRAEAQAKARAAVDRHVLPPSLDFAPANDETESDGIAPPVELPADLVLALDAA